MKKKHSYERFNRKMVWRNKFKEDGLGSLVAKWISDAMMIARYNNKNLSEIVHAMTGENRHSVQCIVGELRAQRYIYPFPQDPPTKNKIHLQKISAILYTLGMEDTHTIFSRFQEEYPQFNFSDRLTYYRNIHTLVSLETSLEALSPLQKLRVQQYAHGLLQQDKK